MRRNMSESMVRAIFASSTVACRIFTYSILPRNMVRLRVKSLITRVHGLWQSYKACFAAYGEHTPVV